MRDDTAPVEDSASPIDPAYGTPSMTPGEHRPLVVDAPFSNVDDAPEHDEGGFTSFVDVLEDRVHGILSDLGIGPDDELPTVADGVDWALYPGTHPHDATAALRNLSQEETIARNDALLLRLREAITPQFGLSWGLFGEIPRSEPETNEWGGESLLETCTTGTWRSTAKLTNPLVKKQLVDAVARMLVVAGFTDVWLRNDPAGASGPGIEQQLAAIESEFGGQTLHDQVVWSLVAREDVWSTSAFELTIIDLRHDRTGEFLKAARARAELRGGPLNSVDLEIVSRGTLSDERAGEFRERAQRYERRDPPML